MLRASEVSRLVGVSVRRLQHWHSRGVLEPSVAAPAIRRARRGVKGRRPGSTIRRYNWDDVLAAMVIRDLLASGLRLRTVRNAMAELAAHPEKPLQKALTSSTRFKLVVSPQGHVLVIELSSNGQSVRSRPCRHNWFLPRLEWSERGHLLEAGAVGPSVASGIVRAENPPRVVVVPLDRTAQTVRELIEDIAV